jgi:hypothetical protein
LTCTAHNKVSSITMGFREALLEDMQSKKEETITWKVKAKRGNYKVSLLGVESLWGDCTFILADWGS